MGDYQYLPFVTFGGFSTTNSNSRIATLGSQRSDFGTRLQPAVLQLLVRAHRHLAVGRPHRARRLRPARSPLEHRHSRLRRGRYHFNGAYTRVEQRGPAERAGPVLGASSCSACPPPARAHPPTPGSTASQFEIAAPGDYRQTSHGLFVQDDWHVNRKLTLNLGAAVRDRPGAPGGGGPQPGRLRRDRGQSHRGRGAWRTTRATRSRRSRPASSTSRAGCSSRTAAIYNTLVKALPRAAFSYLLGDQTVVRGGVGLFSYPFYFDAGNQTGFSQPTGVLTTDQQHDVPDRPHEPAAGRQPDPAGRLVPRPGHRARPDRRHHRSDRARDRPTTRAGRPASSATSAAGWVVELIYVGSRGRNLPGASRAQRHPDAVPVDLAHARHRQRDVPQPAGRRTRSRACCPAPPSTAPPSRGPQLLRPFPQFGSDHHRGVRRLGPLSRRHHPHREALLERELAADHLHALQPARPARSS